MGGTVGKKLANHSAFELGGSDFVYGSVIARKVFECNKGSKLQKDKLIRYVGQLLSLRGFGREEEHSIKGGNLKKVLKERKATLFNTAKKILDELQVKAASAFDLFGEEGGGEKKSEADSSKEDDASLKPWDIVKVWNISDQNLNGQWGIISPENKATNTTDYIVLMQKPCAVPKAKIKAKFLLKSWPLILMLKLTKTREENHSTVSLGGVSFSKKATPYATGIEPKPDDDDTIPSLVAVHPGGRVYLGNESTNMSFSDKNFAKNGSSTIIFKFHPADDIRQYCLKTWNKNWNKQQRRKFDDSDLKKATKSSRKDPVSWELYGLHPRDGSWEKLDQRDGMSEEEMPKKRGTYGMWCEIPENQTLPSRLGLISSKASQSSTTPNEIWVPTTLPSLERQNSFELVKLSRQKSINERAGAEVAIAAFERPFTNLANDHKLGLFLKTAPDDLLQAELYLQAAFPVELLNQSASVIELVTQYAGLHIGKLNIERQAKAMLTLASNASVNHNVELPNIEFKPGDSVKIIGLKKSKVFNGLEGIIVTELKKDPKGNMRHAVQLPSRSNKIVNLKKVNLERFTKGIKSSSSINDGEELLQSGIRKRLGPAFGGLEDVEDLDEVHLGASYMELQVTLKALQFQFNMVTGSTGIPTYLDATYLINADTRRQTAPTSSSGNAKGYSGSAGEEKALGTLLETKRTKEKAQDRVMMLLFQALSNIISRLTTKNRLVRSHKILISNSCIINPYLTYYFRHSVASMAERRELFVALAHVIEALCTDEDLIEIILGKFSTRKTGLPAIFKTLEKQTALMMGRMKESEVVKKTSREIASDAQFAGELNRVLSAGNLQIRRRLKKIATSSKGDGDEEKSDEKDDEKKQKLALESFYNENCVGMVEIYDDKSPEHVFKKEAKNVKGLSSKLMSRLTREVGAMMNGLPPGIFLRVDSKRMDVMRAMIIGPQGSPYTNGVFFFDIYMPSTYPSVSPKCKIITTGRGSFRFNANLYTNGKVCLSILGTWSGPGWEPRYSTLTQVLLSIQAMILGVEEPIANEPGWEYEVGSKRSKNYNGILQWGTMKWAMLHYLQNGAPQGFDDIVKAHFWNKRDELLKKQIPEWKAAAESAGDSGKGPYYEENKISGTVNDTVKLLTESLKKLKPPNLQEEDDEDDDEDESDQDDF